MLNRLRAPYDLATSICTQESKKLIAAGCGLTIVGSIIVGTTTRLNIDFLRSIIINVVTGDSALAFGNKRSLAVFASSFLATSIINHCRKSLLQQVRILTDQAVDSKLAQHQKALALYQDAHPNAILDSMEIKDAYYFYIVLLERYASILTATAISAVLYCFTESPKISTAPIQAAIEIVGLDNLTSAISLGAFCLYVFALCKMIKQDNLSNLNSDKARLNAFNKRLTTNDFTYLGILNSVLKIQEELFKKFWEENISQGLSRNNILLQAAQGLNALMSTARCPITLAYSMYFGRDMFLDTLVQYSPLLPSMASLVEDVGVKFISSYQKIMEFQDILQTSGKALYTCTGAQAAIFRGKMFRSRRMLGSTTGEGLKIEYGKITLIQGQSGCGKSTLSKILAGLASPSLDFGDRTLRLNPALQGLGMIQYIASREIAPVTNMTLRAFFTSEVACSDARLLELLDQFNLSKLDLNKPIPPNLSNGEGKKLLLVKAIAQGSRLIILDETFACFSSKAQPGQISEREKIMDIMKTYATANNSAIIVTSHEIGLEGYADSIISFVENSSGVAEHELKQTLYAGNAGSLSNL